MFLTSTQILIMIFAIALGTMITRFTPFILFPEGKKRPEIIEYLGKALPSAMMGLLVVYCLKDASFISYPYAIPELLSILVTVVLHLWRKNVLLSICGGTVLYMILVQTVFA